MYEETVSQWGDKKIVGCPTVLRSLRSALADESSAGGMRQTAVICLKEGAMALLTQGLPSLTQPQKQSHSEHMLLLATSIGKGSAADAKDASFTRKNPS